MIAPTNRTGNAPMTMTDTGEGPVKDGNKSQFIEPTSQTIPLLPTETARVYTHLHPALLLGALYIIFLRLVEDPVTTLLWAVPPLAVLQSLYCAICLPPSSGSSTPPPASSKTPKKKRVQFAKQSPTSRSKITVSRSGHACYLTLFSCFAYGADAVPCSRHLRSLSSSHSRWAPLCSL